MNANIGLGVDWTAAVCHPRGLDTSVEQRSLVGRQDCEGDAFIGVWGRLEFGNAGELCELLTKCKCTKVPAGRRSGTQDKLKSPLCIHSTNTWATVFQEQSLALWIQNEMSVLRNLTFSRWHICLSTHSFTYWFPWIINDNPHISHFSLLECTVFHLVNIQ